MNIKIFDSWRDGDGFIVCKPVNEPANREDSCHKAGHIAAILGFIGWQRFERELSRLDMYCVDGAIVRHPKTAHSTSRDQVVPWLIGYRMCYPDRDLSFIHRWLRECEVVKERWKKYAWFIKLFYHTPNGDIFQPDHVSVIIRTKRRMSVFDRILLWFGDFWFFIETLYKCFNFTDRHWVNYVLMLEFFIRVRPTFFSFLSHSMFTLFHSKQRIYDEYFFGYVNPPIGDLYRLINF